VRINAVPRHMLQMEPCSHAAMEQWHQYEQTAGSGAGQPSLKQPGTCITFHGPAWQQFLQLDVSSRSACHGFHQFDAAGFNAGQLGAQGRNCSVLHSVLLQENPPAPLRIKWATRRRRRVEWFTASPQHRRTHSHIPLYTCLDVGK